MAAAIMGCVPPKPNELNLPHISPQHFLLVCYCFFSV
jgi:hypothetical protein